MENGRLITSRLASFRRISEDQLLSTMETLENKPISLWHPRNQSASPHFLSTMLRDHLVVFQKAKHDICPTVYFADYTES